MSFYGDSTSGRLLYGDAVDAAAFAGLPLAVRFTDPLPLPPASNPQPWRLTALLRRQGDAEGATQPAALARIHERRERCVAAADYRGAQLLSDLLHVAEPQRPRLDGFSDCAPEGVAAKTDFFMRNGFVAVPNVFAGETLAQLRSAWDRRAPPFPLTLLRSDPCCACPPL